MRSTTHEHTPGRHVRAIVKSCLQRITPRRPRRRFPGWLVSTLDVPDAVRRRLLSVVLLTTGTSILLAGVLMLAHDLAAYRLSLTTELVTQADVLALSTAPAVDFYDSVAANNNLMALSLRPIMLAAALYDEHGRLYAQYARNGEGNPPPQLSADTLQQLSRGPRVSAGQMEVCRPMRSRGRFVGTVYIRARYDIWDRVRAYLGIFAGVMVLAMLLAAVLSAWLHRKITTPLNAMSRVARQIVDKRDYSLRAPKDGDGEIGVVVEAFNRMLDEVEASAAALREADRRKDDFLATLAHELRNPLAPIRHAANLLDSDKANGRQRRWAKEVIARQVQRMALLLDDLLDVSRITLGRLEPRYETVELSQVVNSAVETARPLIEAKRHALEVRLPPGRVLLSADPLRLSQALSNILTNAAKYTDSGGRIVLVAGLGPDGLDIAISDNGIGLSAEAIPRVFQMFTQIDAPVDRAEGGLGIGLALVKGLIGLHGGSVDVSSPGLGKGSTFTVRLPAALLLPQSAMTEPTPPVTAPAAAVAAHVLVADDNRDAAETLGLLLRRAGHQVAVAHDGEQALHMALNTRPQVLLLDIGMPRMTGYEVAARVRAEAWGKNVLLLAITGWGQHEDLQRARAAGFDDHLTKPANPDALMCLIEGFTTRTVRQRSG